MTARHSGAPTPPSADRAQAAAGDRAIGLAVSNLDDDPEATLARLIEVGKALRDRDSAEAIVLGCAGLSPHRTPLQAALGLPVIDPVRAAVEAALENLSSPQVRRASS